MSNDILDSLDSIDDVLGQEEVFAEDEVLEGEIVGDEIESLDTTTLSQTEARAITESIKSTAEALYVMLHKAHQGKAYQALGYDTWRSYVESEFDFSVSHSYRLLNLGEVTQALENVAPEGTKVSITEAQARDIKRALPEVTERVQQETQGKTPDEAVSIIEDIVDEAREETKKEKKPKNDDDTDSELQEQYDLLEEQANALLEENSGSLNSDNEDYSDTYQTDTEGLSPQDTTALYTLYQFIHGKDSLVDPDLMARLIPADEIDTMKEKSQEMSKYFSSLAQELAKL